MNIGGMDKTSNGTVRNFYLHFTVHFNGDKIDLNNDYNIFIASKAALEQDKAMFVFR